MPTYLSNIVPTHKIEQELALLNYQYQTAISEDLPFDEVKKILDEIRKLEKELDRLKVKTSL